MYIYICIYVYIYIYIYLDISIYICMCVCVCVQYMANCFHNLRRSCWRDSIKVGRFFQIRQGRNC